MTYHLDKDLVHHPIILELLAEADVVMEEWSLIWSV